MQKTGRMILAILLMASALLFAGLPSASAAGATEVWVNNVKLDAGNPYWKNENAPASPTDWNAHFDAATYTLTLKDAEIDTVNPATMAMVYAGADINIVFQSQNSLSYVNTVYSFVYGVHAIGDMTIDGNGSADIQINAPQPSAQAAAIYGEAGLTIYGGNLTMDVQAGFVAVGVRGFNGCLYAGGRMDIKTYSSRSYAVFENNALFRMTGGRITAESISANELAYALRGHEISLEGGEGVFRAYGPNEAYGLVFIENDFSYTGGRYIFSGDISALLHDSNFPSVAYTLSGGPVYVSEVTNGGGMRLWTSEAKDGRMESYLSETALFKYVQFGVFPEVPQTGDGTHPWLWAGIALLGLLGASGAAAALRRRTRSR